MKKIFIYFFFCASIKASYLDYIYQDRNPSINSFGQVGLIQIPTANTKGEANLAFTWNQNSIWKIGTLTVTPFDWMEASYFYYRPQDLYWTGTGNKGDYLDKGFNVKFLYKPKNNNLPNIAIGLDDFAGTGYFTREYIVATNNYQSFNMTLGIGWGMFASDKSFKNPLSIFSDRFLYRPLESAYNEEGGNPSFDKWFRGNASLFGGFEFYIPKAKGLKLKLEYDPFNYNEFTAVNRPDANRILRKKDSNINYGLSYPLNKFITFDLSYFKGNTFNFSLIFSYGFKDDRNKKPKFKPDVKTKEKPQISFYEDLLINLNNNRLFLQTANIEENILDVSISTSDIRNPIRSSSYAGYIANKVATAHDKNFSRINISHINMGVEVNEISYLSKYLDKSNNTPIEIIEDNTIIKPGNNDYLNDSFKPKVIFPAYFSSIKPVIVSHIGRPDRFYFGGLDLVHISELQFSRKLSLSSQINYSIINNFNDGRLDSRPDSVMRLVRTELVDYLQQSDLYISRMHLDYLWSPKKEYYAKISAGIYETMYGGAGIEILYAPFNENYAIGLESFYVKKRNYDQRFKFLNYETSTGHINFYYQLPMGIEAKFSYGRYLAKDDGFTLDLSKTSRSGFKSGFYFTRTDVPAEIFGEGSFDKGFYFQIPLDLFSKGFRGDYTGFKLSPLTRDGGAKLAISNDIRGLINNSSHNNFKNKWNGFLD